MVSKNWFALRPSAANWKTLPDNVSDLPLNGSRPFLRLLSDAGVGLPSLSSVAAWADAAAAAAFSLFLCCCNLVVTLDTVEKAAVASVAAVAALSAILQMPQVVGGALTKEPTFGICTLMRRGSTALISPLCWMVPIQIRGVQVGAGGRAAIAAATVSAWSLVTRNVRDRRASSMIFICSSIGRSSLFLIYIFGVNKESFLLRRMLGRT
jgi:hypothetical protein